MQPYSAYHKKVRMTQPAFRSQRFTIQRFILPGTKMATWYKDGRPVQRWPLGAKMATRYKDGRPVQDGH